MPPHPADRPRLTQLEERTTPADLTFPDLDYVPAATGDVIVPAATPVFADMTGDGRADSLVLNDYGRVLVRAALPNGRYDAPVVVNGPARATGFAVVGGPDGPAVVTVDGLADPVLHRRAADGRF